MLHVGDYIYESTMAGLPGGLDAEPMTLGDYRMRHALYRGDPQLRHAHHTLPWVLTWDDHEVDNDYDNTFADVARRGAAYQAYYEHMPIRLTPAGPPDPVAGTFQIYRRLQFGDLLDLLVLDTRQYRDPPPGPNGDPNTPSRTMLGASQRSWLLSELSASTTAWRAMASAIMMTDVSIVGGLPALFDDMLPGGDGIYYYPDAWQGYRAERAAILGHIAANGIDDVVTLSGDIHRSFVAGLKVDFDNPLAPFVATEFCGTSITSQGGDVHWLGQDVNNNLARLITYPINLHLRYMEGERHGYTVCEVTPEQWTATYRQVGITNPLAGASTLAAFRVQRGVPGPQMIAGSGGNPVPL